MQESSLTYSELYYLFADEFSAKGGFIGLNDAHPSGLKLQSVPLAELLVFSALAYLNKNGYVAIEPREEKKLLFLNSENIYLRKLKDADYEVTGLEERILANVSSSTPLLYAILNLLSQDQFDPWGAVILISKNSLITKGYVNKEEHKKLIFVNYTYSLSDKSLDSEKAQFLNIQSYVKEFSQLPYSTLIKKLISKAITIRQEKSDSFDN